MRVKLEYGRTGLMVELPDERVVRTLSYKDAVPIADPGAAIRQSLARPRGTVPLAMTCLWRTRDFAAVASRTAAG